MEVQGGSKNKAWVLISEFLGTAMLGAAVNWGGTSGTTAQCVGMVVFIMARVFGPVSNGHFNPAVTIAVLIKHKHEKCGPTIFYSLLIILAQIFGCMLGCALCLMGFPLGAQSGNQLPKAGGHYLTQLCPANGCNDGGKLMGQAFLVEFMMTFLFVTFVLQIIYRNGAKEDQTPVHPGLVNSIAIGVALYACVQTAAGISGGCINPAVGIVQPIFQKVMNARIYPSAPKTQLVYQGAYVGATLLGGIFAGVFQRFVQEKMVQKAEAAAEADPDREVEMQRIN